MLLKNETDLYHHTKITDLFIVSKIVESFAISKRKIKKKSFSREEGIKKAYR